MGSKGDDAARRSTSDDGTGPVEVGSISERVRHVEPRDTYWHWGVDTMPLMDHGGPVAKWRWLVAGSRRNA